MSINPDKHSLSLTRLALLVSGLSKATDVDLTDPKLIVRFNYPTPCGTRNYVTKEVPVDNFLVDLKNGIEFLQYQRQPRYTDGTPLTQIELGWKGWADARHKEVIKRRINHLESLTKVPGKFPHYEKERAFMRYYLDDERKPFFQEPEAETVRVVLTNDINLDAQTHQQPSTAVMAGARLRQWMNTHPRINIETRLGWVEREGIPDRKRWIQSGKFEHDQNLAYQREIEELELEVKLGREYLAEIDQEAQSLLRTTLRRKFNEGTNRYHFEHWPAGTFLFDEVADKLYQFSAVEEQNNWIYKWLERDWRDDDSRLGKIWYKLRLLVIDVSLTKGQTSQLAKEEPEAKQDPRVTAYQQIAMICRAEDLEPDKVVEYVRQLTHRPAQYDYDQDMARKEALESMRVYMMMSDDSDLTFAKPEELAQALERILISQSQELGNWKRMGNQILEILERPQVAFTDKEFPLKFTATFRESYERGKFMKYIFDKLGEKLSEAWGRHDTFTTPDSLLEGMSIFFEQSKRNIIHWHQVANFLYQNGALHKHSPSTEANVLAALRNLAENRQESVRQPLRPTPDGPVILYVEEFIEGLLSPDGQMRAVIEGGNFQVQFRTEIGKQFGVQEFVDISLKALRKYEDEVLPLEDTMTDEEFDGVRVEDFNSPPQQDDSSKADVLVQEGVEDTNKPDHPGILDMTNTGPDRYGVWFVDTREENAFDTLWEVYGTAGGEYLTRQNDDRVIKANYPIQLFEELLRMRFLVIVPRPNTEPQPGIPFHDWDKK